MVITLETWDGNVPQSFRDSYVESAMYGDVDKLYDIYNEHFSMEDAFVQHLKDEGEYLVGNAEGE